MFEVYVSPFVIEEAQRGDTEAAAKRMKLIGDLPILAVDDEITRITEAILHEGLIPKKASTDASHIAVATRHDMDFLLTWNCKHIANAQMLRYIERVVNSLDYELPLICTPDELMGDEDDE